MSRFTNRSESNTQKICKDELDLLRALILPFKKPCSIWMHIPTAARRWNTTTV